MKPRLRYVRACPTYASGSNCTLQVCRLIVFRRRFFTLDTLCFAPPGRPGRQRFATWTPVSPLPPQPTRMHRECPRSRLSLEGRGRCTVTAAKVVGNSAGPGVTVWRKPDTAGRKADRPHTCNRSHTPFRSTTCIRSTSTPFYYSMSGCVCARSSRTADFPSSLPTQPCTRRGHTTDALDARVSLLPDTPAAPAFRRGRPKNY